MVGRDRPLAELNALLEAARAGRGRAALVRGEAGMGKTTLVETLAANAESAGVAAVWGWCSFDQTAPYLPWVPLFRHLGVVAPNREAVRGPAADDLDRQRLFAEIVEGLGSEPLLLVIEDIHWADPPSLVLLRVLTEALPRMPICLVVTMRDDPLEASAEVAAVLRDLPTAVLRVTLPALTIAEVTNLLAALAGERADPTVGAQVRERTGGNPFFVTEVGRMLADPAAATEAVPPGARAVLERRLARLDPATYRILRVAALIGEPIELPLVATVLDQPESTVTALLAAGAEAKLLHASGRERPRFAHALIREVLAAAIPAGEQAELHDRTARALEERGGAEPGVLAYHWSRSHGPHARQHAATWSLAEARLARRRLGFEQAVTAYERGLQAPAEDPLTLLLELAEAQRLAGDTAGSRRTYLAVAQQARTLDRADEFAAAALGLGGGVAGFEVGLRDEEQVALLREALTRLPAGDGELRAAVLARMSVALAELGTDTERITLAHDAVAMAQRVGDPAVRVAALAAYCDAVAGPAHIAERLDAAIQMRQLAETTGDTVGVLLARRLAVVALAEQGHLGAADAEGAAYARTAARLGVPHYQWLPAIWRGRQALLQGDIASALRAAAEAEAVGAEAGSVNAEYMAMVVRWHAWRLEGTLGAHRDDLRRVFADLLDVPSAYGAQAEAAVAAGDLAESRRLVRAAHEIGLDAMAHDSEWLAGVWAVGEVAIRLGDADVARETYETMAPFSRTFVTEGLAASVLGASDHLLGRLAAFLGDQAAAKRHLSAALVAHRDTASPVLIDSTEKALAELGRPRTAAPPTMEDAVGEFRRSGRLWHVAYRGQTSIVPDSKGMADVATLLQAAGRDVHVLDLFDPTGTARGTASGAGDRIDAAARAAYRRRLEELDEDLAVAERDGDLGQAERLRAEQEFLAAELASALGLGGRARPAADPVERARKAVAMRIATALRAIEAVHGPLARHLRLAVTTGRFCSYRPEHPVRWHG
jgi:hypothetical protein